MSMMSSSTCKETRVHSSATKHNTSGRNYQLNFHIYKKRDDTIIQELLSHNKLTRYIVNPSDASISMWKK